MPDLFATRLAAPLRLAVSVAGVAAAVGLTWVPLPGVRAESLPPESAGLMQIGVASILTATLGVELLAWLNPAWRGLRLGLGGRARLERWTRLVAIGLAGAQAASLLPLLDARSALESGLLAWSSLVAGVALLIALADAMDRYGLGSGLATLAVLGPLRSVGEAWQASVALARAEGDATRQLMPILLPVAATGLLLLWQPRGGGGGQRLPLSGLAPVWMVGALTLVLEDGPWRWGALAALGLGLSLLFWPPGKVAALLARGPVDPEAEPASFVGGATRTLLYLFALLGLERTLHTQVGGAMTAIWLAMGTGLLFDLATSFTQTAEHGPRTRVWADHRPYAVDTALDLLASRGIGAHIHGIHLRSLLAGFGPWAPLEIWAEPRRAAEAEALLEAALRP